MFLRLVRRLPAKHLRMITVPFLLQLLVALVPEDVPSVWLLVARTLVVPRRHCPIVERRNKILEHEVPVRLQVLGGHRGMILRSIVVLCRPGILKIIEPERVRILEIFLNLAHVLHLL